jgi:formylglycine-generating enzyme required for sulfatase activity
MRDGADNLSRPSARTKQNRPTREASRPLHKNVVWVPDGTFLMGSNDFYPEERPVHRVAFDGLHRCGVQYLRRAGAKKPTIRV